VIVQMSSVIEVPKFHEDNAAKFHGTPTPLRWSRNDDFRIVGQTVGTMSS
jgi:hypothetical protein